MTYSDPGDSRDDPRTRRGKPEALDLFSPPQPKREKPAHVPHQPSSSTSREAAKRIEPQFAGNRLAVFREMAKYPKGITRKQLAAILFHDQQQYVSGPVAVLIEEGFVMEEPARDRWNCLVTRLCPKTGGQIIVPRRIDGSAVLLLTSKGKARAAA